MSNPWEPLGKIQVSRGEPIQLSPISCLTHHLSLVSFNNLFVLFLSQLPNQILWSQLGAVIALGKSFCMGSGVWQDCESFPTCTLHQGARSSSRGQEEKGPRSHFPFSSCRELGSCFYLHNFFTVCFHSLFWGSYTFSSLSVIHVGALSNYQKFLYV